MNFLILSAHDYRTPRRASIHFVADELKALGELKFFSLRYSLLSRFKKDFRYLLDQTANQSVIYKGVSCYLWKPWIHPFNLRRNSLLWLETLIHKWFQKNVPNILKQWITESDVIIFESGLASIYVELAKKLNPNAKLIYKASDTLDAIDVSNFVKQYFLKTSHIYDHVAIISTVMADTIQYKNNISLVPHGVEKGLESKGDPTPYRGGVNAVSIGSMLFDPSIFITASKAFPEITFHLIGTGSEKNPEFGSNVILYDHMPFNETLRYLKHANISIAPYREKGITSYLADSSMKLLQNEVFGIPSICPNSVVGTYTSRFGYEPNDNKSIIAAINKALDLSDFKRTREILLWNEVVDRLLDPNTYLDTRFIR